MKPTRQIDGTNQILGRLASSVAKDLLAGYRIEIVNCENVRMSGNYAKQLEKTFIKFERGPKGNPEKGPHYSRMPDRFVKSVVRTMVPNRNRRGILALKQLRCHIGVPKSLEGQTFETGTNNVRHKTFTIGELCKGLGASW